ncbi:MAG: VanZ family protein [Cyclonatronaceae bacterium]
MKNYLNADFFIRMIPFLFGIWMLITLYLTAMPAKYLVESRVFQYDKLGHFALFGGWAFLYGLFMMYYRRKTDVGLNRIFWIGFLFGAFIEMYQYLMPVNRSGSIYDLAANALGCLAAVLALGIIKQYFPEQNVQDYSKSTGGEEQVPV